MGGAQDSDDAVTGCGIDGETVRREMALPGAC
jgi:hypothetical protein